MRNEQISKNLFQKCKCIGKIVKYRKSQTHILGGIAIQSSVTVCIKILFYM